MVTIYRWFDVDEVDNGEDGNDGHGDGSGGDDRDGRSWWDGAICLFLYQPAYLFLTTDSNGKVQKDLWNEGTKHTYVKYYYQDGEECELYFKHS